MSKKKLPILIVLFLSLFFQGLMYGCQKNNNSDNDSNKKNEVPKALNNIEQDIKDLFKELKIDKDSDNSETNKENNTESSEGNEENVSNDDKQNTKEENNQGSNDEENKKWTAIDKKILELHENWNSLQPEAIKTGVSREIIDSFSNTLNYLTIETGNKSEENTKMYSVELLGNMADFLDYYDSDYPADFKRIEYSIMDIKLASDNDKWDNAALNIEKIKSYWTIVKASIDNKKERQKNELETAIYELEKAVGQNDPYIVNIKANITLTIIDDLGNS